MIAYFSGANKFLPVSFVYFMISAHNFSFKRMTQDISEALGQQNFTVAASGRMNQIMNIHTSATFSAVNCYLYKADSQHETI